MTCRFGFTNQNSENEMQTILNSKFCHLETIAKLLRKCVFRLLRISLRKAENTRVLKGINPI